MIRLLFVASYAANLLALGAAWVLLPARVATHFGADGRANAWGAVSVFAPVMILLHSLLFLALWTAPRLLRSASARWINLPNKDHWLRPENRGRGEHLLRAEMTAFGAVLFLFMLAANLLTIAANRLPVARLNSRVFLAAFCLFIIYTAVWCLRLFRVFRRPSA